MLRDLPGNGRLAPVLLAVAALLLASADAASVTCSGNASISDCAAGCTPVNSTCSQCAVGKFKSVTGNAACSNCLAGKHSVTAGSDAQGDCVDCTAGKYAEAAGASVCASCPVGRVAPLPAARSCHTCDPGKFSNTTTAASTCINCAAGKTSSVGSSAVGDCVVCTAGKFTWPCADKHQPSWPQYLPAACADGGLCRNCPSGKSSPALSTDADQCFFCDAGKYAADGSTCLNCTAGKYAAASGSSVCTNCAAGKHSVTAGSDAESNCTNCAAGQYAAAGASVCTSCPVGKVARFPGAPLCVFCYAGKYAVAGSACLDCGKGKYAASGASICTNCAAGKTSPAGATECTTIESAVKSSDVKSSVVFTVTMPYSKTEFEKDKQDRYKRAVADAAGTDKKYVELKIVEKRRAGSIKVETKIVSTSADGAKKLKENLGSGEMLKKKINEELKKQNLKESTAISEVATSSAGRTGLSTGKRTCHVLARRM